jgi:hypothetical protein
MKKLSLHFLLALVIGMFVSIGGSTAKPLSKKQTAELKCDLKFTSCDDRCDRAKTTTPKKYWTCRASCSHEHRHCLNRTLR